MSEPTFAEYIRELRTELKNYIDTRTEYTKLVAYEKMANATGSLAFILLVAGFFFFTFFFVSITLALYLSEILNNQVYGFALVSGFDILIVLMLLIRKDAVQHFISEKVAASLLKDHKNDQLKAEAPYERTGKDKS
ncbi:MAG: phage holin family protein [Bacteroidia bacterium]|nr:phage holin family protein [Bacteroidia bacterium]